jgi:hypothetical protein
MRVLVISEKAATPEIHQYKFTKTYEYKFNNELARGGTPFE